MTNTGTFTRRCPQISAVAVWYNDGNHASHSTRTCRTWGAPRRHTHRDIWARTTITDAPTAWICSVCTDDDPTPADRPVSKIGTATCLACDAVLPVTKFPTVRVFGYQVRDTRRCRPCGTAHAPMPDAEQHFTIDPLDMPRMGPDDMALRVDGRLVGWVRVPGSSDRGFDRDGWATDPGMSEEAAA